MLLVPILTNLLLISPSSTHAKRGNKSKSSSTSPSLSSSLSSTLTSHSITTLTQSTFPSDLASISTSTSSVTTISPHDPVYTELVNALVRLDDHALHSLARLIQTWSFIDSSPSTSLPATPSSSSTPERKYSDPDSDDWPMNFQAEDLGENLLASDDEAPGPSTPLPPPPSRPSPDPPNPSDEYTPRIRPVRLVPMRIDNQSQPLHLNSTAPFALDSFLTTRIEPNKPYRVKCWTGVLMRHMSPIYPLPDDCLKALDLLVAGDKQDAPILFSQDRGYKLPHRVAFDTCAIVLTISGGPTAAVTTTFRDLGNIVRIILTECMDYEKDERGGMLTFEDLHVAVAGRVKGARGDSGRSSEAESFAYG